MSLPDVDVPSPPVGLGRDCIPFLEHFGLVAMRQPIRSSDEHYIGDPFIYYLVRRLGITSPFTYSAALSRGTWFHHACEHLHLASEDAATQLEDRLWKRIAELKAICKELNVQPQAAQEILNREHEDFHNACAWADAASTIQVGSGGTSIRDYLDHPDWLKLQVEDPVYVDLFNDGECVAQFDYLLLQRSTDTVWIFDVKTTGDSPLKRLESCHMEFQTFHYMRVFQEWFSSGAVHEKFGLGDKTRFGGMIHAAVRKPKIKMCGEDRPFTIDDSPLKSGPRKGQPRNEKVYHGEPSPHLYRQRCLRWYKAEEEYEDLRKEWEVDPPVNFSHTKSSILQSAHHNDAYWPRINAIQDMRNAEPFPGNFAMGSPVAFKDTSPYRAFKLHPVDHWPTLIAQLGLVVKHRDPHHAT